MRFITNKEKGNSGLGMAIAYFTTSGYIVSIPLNDTQDYDLFFRKLFQFFEKTKKTRKNLPSEMVRQNYWNGLSAYI